MTGDHGNAITMRANERFLTQIFGPVFKYSHVCGVAGDPSKKESGPWGGGYAQRLLWGIGDKTNNYFCVSLFTSEQRRISTFDRLICLAVDDVGPKLDPDLVELLLGPPTWITETSQDNFQWGYKLAEPLTDPAQSDALIRSVWTALTDPDPKGKRKDPGMNSVTRYVRLPTGLNLKETLGKPWPVRLVKMDVSIGLKSNTIKQLLHASGGAGTTGQGISDPDLDELGLAAEPGRQTKTNKIKASRANVHSDDALLRSMRKLGLVLGPPRETAMGWGFDIRCPWVDEHTDRAETGTVYVAGAGKFKCQHGHCIDRTVEDVRGRLDEMLRDAGHKGGLIAEEFDVVDVKDVPVPPQGLKPKPGTNEIRFFNHFLVMGGRNMFYDLLLGHEATASEIDAKWAEPLKDVLPRNAKGKSILPSQWLRKQGRKVNGFIGWPGMPRVVAPDPAEPERLYINTWEPMKRPLAKAPESEVNAKAIMRWLSVFWHVVGWDTDAERALGEILLDWIALVLGEQSLKPGWHVIIMGQQGVGKDTLILPVMSTLGPEWAQTLDCGQIGQSFNEWEAKRLIQFTETNQNTRGSLTAHDVMTLLKALFDNTRGWVTINPKYRDKYKSRNVVMGWFTSNEREPLRLQPGDRRFVVLDRHETKPLPPSIYSQLHDWLRTPIVSPSGQAITGAQRVAEFLYRRWDQMDDARRNVLFGTAPMTVAKQALLDRLKHPIADWIERCIALDPADPLTFPDIVTAGYVHSRLFTAIRTGGEGLPGGVGLPSLSRIGLHLKDAKAVVLNDGKQVRIKGSPVVLWAVRNSGAHSLLPAHELAKVFVAAAGGSSAGLIN